MFTTQTQNLKHSAQESCKANFQKIEVGTRVYCILYGGHFGTVVKVHGTATPETIRTLLGGVVSMGGSAKYDIIFDNGSQSLHCPESIVRGVQWTVFTEEQEAKATPDEIEKLYQFAADTRAKEEREAEEAARQREERRQFFLTSDEYKHLTPLTGDNWHSLKNVHKNIRQDLKKHFPTTKFSVTGSYDAVTIRWTDGATQEQVESIANKFESYSTDYTGDYRDPTPSAFNDIFGGKKYVFFERKFSDDKIQKAIDVIKQKYGLTEDLTVEGYHNGEYYNLGRERFVRGISELLYKELKTS